MPLEIWHMRNYSKDDANNTPFSLTLQRELLETLSTQPEKEETDYCTCRSSSCLNTLERIRSHPLTEMVDSDNRTDVSKAPYSSRSCAGKPLKFCVVQESRLFFTWGGATHVRGQTLTITLKWNDGNELYASLPDFSVHRFHPRRIIHSKIFTTFKIINIEEGAVRTVHNPSTT